MGAVEFGEDELIRKIDGENAHFELQGEGVRGNQKNWRTIPLLKHRCIGMNVLFQKFERNFVRAIQMEAALDIVDNFGVRKGKRTSCL